MRLLDFQSPSGSRSGMVKVSCPATLPLKPLLALKDSLRQTPLCPRWS